MPCLPLSFSCISPHPVLLLGCLLDTAAMTERKIQRHDSDSDSSTDPNTLAPEGHKLRKSTTALRFASSKLALVNNPVQEVHEGEEQRLIPNPHAKAPTPEPAGAQKTLRFTKVFHGAWEERAEWEWIC